MKKKFLFFLLIILILAGLFAFGRSGIYVSSSDCVGCGDCREVCPVNAITIVDGKSVIDAEACIQCEICVKSCTYNAIRKNRKAVITFQP